MVAIISLCKHKLHEEEFVRPVFEIVRGDREIVRAEDVRPKKLEHESAIVCGTALKDFEYLKMDFSWLLDFKYVLGICAGYQVLARLFNAELSGLERIGVHDVVCVRKNPLFKGKFRVYFLHELALEKVPENFEVLAMCENEVAAFRVESEGGEFYGVSFHPEVLNPEIIERFVELLGE